MLNDERRSMMWASHTEEVREATSPSASPSGEGAGGAAVADFRGGLAAARPDLGRSSPQKRLNYIDTFRLAMGDNVEPSAMDAFYEVTGGEEPVDRRQAVSPLVIRGMEGTGARDDSMPTSRGSGGTLDGLDLFGLAEATVSPSRKEQQQQRGDVGAAVTASSAAGPMGGHVPGPAFSDVPSAPLLSSSDKMVSITSDQYEAMRSTNEALAGALADERAARLALDERMSMLALDSDESKTRGHLAENTLRLEVKRLETLVRHMSKENDLESVFAALETEAQRLARENAALRRRNVRLEEARLGAPRASGSAGSDPDLHDTPLTTSPPARAGREGKGATPLQRMLKIQGDTPLLDRNELVRLRAELRRCIKEKDTLSAKLTAMASKERHYRMAIKLVDDANRKLRQTYQEKVRLQDDVAVAVLQRDQAQAALGALRDDIGGLKSDNVALKKEVHGLRAEVNMHRKAASTYAGGQRRAVILEQGTSHAVGSVGRTQRQSKAAQQSAQSQSQSLGSGTAEVQDENGYFHLQAVPVLEPTATKGAVVDSVAGAPPPLPVYTKVLNNQEKDKENFLNRGHSVVGGRSRHPGVTKSMQLLEEMLQRSAPEGLAVLRELDFQLDAKDSDAVVETSRALGRGLRAR